MSTPEPKPTSRDSAPHYTWGECCDGWRLLDGEDLSVIHERMPSGTRETRHSHAKARQLFFVLSGRLELECEGVRNSLGPTEALHVPPGTVHEASNPGPEPVEFLVISAPTTRSDRVLA